MTPRRRILAVLNHERPDRVPTDGWFHPEVVASLKEHFRTHDWEVVLHELGIEGWKELAPQIHWTHPTKRWLDARTYADSWGVRFRVGAGDRYEEWLSGPLQDAATAHDVARYRFPLASDIEDPPDYARQVAELKHAGNFVSGSLDNPFKRFWHLRGYENALMDYLDNRELLEAIYDQLFALATCLALAMTRTGVDLVKVVGDVAMQDRLIMGPAAWREIDKPRWARLIAACHAVNPFVRFFFHSDGKLTDLLDDLIEVGFTVINPIQPECMDPVDIKQRWGDRITLHGGISLQRTLPFGTVAEVRDEVETLIDHCGRNGGLILMPSNVIQPDTPVENIVACYHAARDFDLAGCQGVDSRCTN